MMRKNGARDSWLRRHAADILWTLLPVAVVALPLWLLLRVI